MLRSWIISQYATSCDGAYLVPPMLFDFVDDLSHLTLLYMGARTLLMVLKSHELFTKLDAISPVAS